VLEAQFVHLRHTPALASHSPCTRLGNVHTNNHWGQSECAPRAVVALAGNDLHTTSPEKHTGTA
jgi:hypothetical protein